MPPQKGMTGLKSGKRTVEKRFLDYARNDSIGCCHFDRRRSSLYRVISTGGVAGAEKSNESLLKSKDDENGDSSTALGMTV